MRTGIGRRPAIGDRRSAIGDRRSAIGVCDRARIVHRQPHDARCTMHERMIPRSGAGGAMHAVNCTDAHALIEVMSKRRGCD
ncbi:hypothetical protein DF051_18115 [Burkholderia contaminans]|uniref:Uncharacterized protein n=1 Tax=Burkholderia contaminans TaxID=488447 RepID=A0A3N8PRL0_9BURK|nr:hypothetical protein DF051_18115 [Burkholderia contaminans]